MKCSIFAHKYIKISPRIVGSSNRFDWTLHRSMTGFPALTSMVGVATNSLRISPNESIFWYVRTLDYELNTSNWI